MRRLRSIPSAACVLALSAAACAASPGDAPPEEPLGAVSSAVTGDGGAGDLVEVASFGTNPGALKMFEHVPTKLAPSPGLVLVLHGCLQGAADAAKLGWNELSDELGFVVVYPEQTTANNVARCFNWAGEYGNPDNLQRGKGENQSLKDMVDAAVATHKVDPKKVFIVGFSAGGGTAAVAAAVWPDVFAAAATISGVPYDCTTTYAEVSGCQKPGKDKTPAEWASKVKAAHASYAGPYPRMSIWQGASDSIVGTLNRTELVDQWTEVHGVGQTPAVSDTVDGATHTAFKDKSGKVVVESFEIPAMDHGYPVLPSKQCGVAGSYAIDKGICATRHIATFFGLTTGGAPPGSSSGGSSSSSSSSSSSGGQASSSSSGGAATPGGGAGPGAAAPADPADPGSAGSTCAAAHGPGHPSSFLGAGALALALATALIRRKGNLR